MANKWSANQEQMIVEEPSFEMKVGVDKNKFQYKVSVSDVYSYPFIKKKLNNGSKFSNLVKIYLTKFGFQIGYGLKKLVPYFD